MSKFIDRLKNVSQPPPPPMGFRSAKIEPRPRIQLVADIEGKVFADKLSHANAAIFTELKNPPAETTWGARIGPQDEVEAAVKAGADFVILPQGSRVVTPDKTTGKILELNASITDVLLRTANDLPVDAVSLSEEGTEITWQKLMLFHRFAGLLTKPVLVNVSLTITAEELQLTWDTGVSGLIVKINNEKAAVALGILREKIDNLQYPSRKKKDKITPVLPHVADTGKKDEGEEDGDDDDD